MKHIQKQNIENNKQENFVSCEILEVKIMTN